MAGNHIKKSNKLQVLIHTVDTYTKAAVEGTKPSRAVVRHQTSNASVKECTEHSAGRTNAIDMQKNLKWSLSVESK